MVKKLLEERIRPVMVKDMPPLKSADAKIEDYGWRMHLAERSALFSEDATQESMSRRMHGVMTLESRVTYISNVEAWCLAADLDLDRDTDIPTLPGNKPLALDLLYWRARAVKLNVRKSDLVKFVPVVLELSNAILDSPELMSELQDDAPFNCLRPEQRP
ncbi:MAG: hypothetical protein H0U53_10980 [Actinobacteria bacterium]|nr:hypothetical protein [Actinomycetota bacterium]